MAVLETVRIKLPAKFKDKLKTDFLIINMIDFDPRIHTPYDVDEEVKAAMHSDEWQPNVEEIQPITKNDDPVNTLQPEITVDQAAEDDKFVEDCETRGLDPQLCVYSADELHEYARNRFYTWISKTTAFDDMVREIMLMEQAAEEVYELDDMVDGEFEDDESMDITVDDFEWEIDEDNPVIENEQTTLTES